MPQSFPGYLRNKRCISISISKPTERISKRRKGRRGGSLADSATPKIKAE
jgi:hypothetical protein